MHVILKEILRNLKRHRGTAEWQEPAREPAAGEVRGFRWEFPNGRKLELLLEPPDQILVTKDAADLPPDAARTFTLSANELETMRALYRWAAGGK